MHCTAHAWCGCETTETGALTNDLQLLIADGVVVA